MILINGRAIAERIEARIKETLETKKVSLSVASLFVGEATDSALYTKRKAEAAERLGIHFSVERLPNNATVDDVKAKIIELNTRPDLDGYIVQLPLPEPIRHATDELLNFMNPTRDVDSLTKINRDALLTHEKGTVPFLPTPIGAVLITLASIFPETTWEEQLPFLSGQLPNLIPSSLQTQQGIIVSDGDVFGQTLEAVLKDSGMQVAVVQSSDAELKSKLRSAKLVITAVGAPHFITSDMISDETIIIDVGTTLVRGKTVGDVNPQGLENRNVTLTPVPGGIGPVTVAMLFANALTLKLFPLS